MAVPRARRAHKALAPEDRGVDSRALRPQVPPTVNEPDEPRDDAESHATAAADPATEAQATGVDGRRFVRAAGALAVLVGVQTLSGFWVSRRLTIVLVVLSLLGLATAVSGLMRDDPVAAS